VRRRLLLPIAAGLLGLTLVGTAIAGNGGVAPRMPESPNAQRISTAYWVIMVFTGLIFLLVEGVLITFVVRFRRRRRARTAEGPQIHGSTRLELIWTVAPVVILAIIGTVIFYELPGIKNVPSASAGNREEIAVQGRQFYWQFEYPNGGVSIDTLTIPVQRVSNMSVTAPGWDVIHSWWIPNLGGKVDAIPGKINHTWFKPEREGVFQGQCAEFCGIQHAAMFAWVDVVSDSEYRAFLDERRRLLEEGSPQLGKEIFDGVCMKCHRMQGPKLIGPDLGGNPVLKDKNALRAVVDNGRGKMPSVGKDWPEGEFDALFAYTKTLGPTGESTSGG